MVQVETKVIDFKLKGCIVEQKCKKMFRKEELGMGCLVHP